MSLWNNMQSAWNKFDAWVQDKMASKTVDATPLQNTETHEALSSLRNLMNMNNKTMAGSRINPITGEVEEYNAGEITRNMSLAPGVEAPRTEADKLLGTLENISEPDPYKRSALMQNTPYTPIAEAQQEAAKYEVNLDLSPVNNSLSAQTQEIKKLGQAIETSQNRNWELAKEHARNQYELSLASGVAGVVESFGSYLYNKKEIKYAKKNLEFEQQMQEKEMDRELVEYETALNDQLSESFANLDQTAAYKNVDLSSQAITGSKQGAVEEMGKDITNETTKMKLRKAALNLQMTYQRNQLNAQKAQLKTGLVSSIAGNMLQMRKAYNDYKSYDKENFSPTIRADIRGKK